MSDDYEDSPNIEAPPLKPFSRKGSHAAAPSKPSGNFRPEVVGSQAA